MKEITKFHPPRIAVWIIKKIHTERITHTFLGDLDEISSSMANESGAFGAYFWYWNQTFLCLANQCKHFLGTNTTLAKNNLKIAFRNIKNSKVYTFVNIFGLSIGFASCLIIFLYVHFESSYEDFNENADRVYRVNRHWYDSQGLPSLTLGFVAPPAGPELKNDFAEIELMGRMSSVSGIVQYGDKSFIEPKLFTADNEIFELLSWKLIKGDPATALSEPNTLVLTEAMAKKYFGDADPMNKVMELHLFGTVFTGTVTGIMEEVPANSHVHADILYTNVTTDKQFPSYMKTDWSSNIFATYIMLPGNYNIATLEDQMQEWLAKKTSVTVSKNTLSFTKISDIHLHSALDAELETNGSFVYVIIFSIIAVLILFIACFNFMSLSTARSSQRAKEVGMRKVVGAYKHQLIGQFLSESLIITFLSLLTAIVIVKLALAEVNNFIQKPLSFDPLTNFDLLASLLGLSLLIGLLSGSYPAFFLSSFRPARVLKGDRAEKSSAAYMRSVLVVGQFTVSLALMIGMGIIGDQMDYIMDKKLGFDDDQLITFGLPSSMQGVRGPVKTEILDNPGIISATYSSRIPSDRLLDNMSGSFASSDSLAPIGFRLTAIRIDHDFFNTLGIELAEGRTMSREMPSDTLGGFVVNETTVGKLGLKNNLEAIDKRIIYNRISGKIIGVVRDFHFESLHQPIKPIIFWYESPYFNSLTVKIDRNNIQSAISHLTEIWHKYNGDTYFYFHFVNDRIENLYQAEIKVGQLFQGFTVLAIFIACLGLFGLASYTVERRIKEIGIRKVLGASISTLFTLVSNDFIKLVLLANIIAVPASYYLINNWFLQSFAYKTDLQLWTFVGSSLIVLAIALLTTAYHCIGAAGKSPVIILKYE